MVAEMTARYGVVNFYFSEMILHFVVITLISNVSNMKEQHFSNFRIWFSSWAKLPTRRFEPQKLRAFERLLLATRPPLRSQDSCSEKGFVSMRAYGLSIYTGIFP